MRSKYWFVAPFTDGRGIGSRMWASSVAGTVSRGNGGRPVSAA